MLCTYWCVFCFLINEVRISFGGGSLQVHVLYLCIITRTNIYTYVYYIEHLPLILIIYLYSFYFFLCGMFRGKVSRSNFICDKFIALIFCMLSGQIN